MTLHAAIARGSKASLPITMSYAPTGIAFGLLATQSGMEWYYAVLMAAIVFAGAAQFASLQLLRAGAGPLEVLFTTFMINLRLIIVSAAMATRFRQGTPEQQRQLRYLPPLSFIMSDNAFLIASLQPPERINAPFLLGLNGTSYLTWVLGTLVGALIGPLIPPLLGVSMGITIYALFTAMLVVATKKEPRLLIIAGAAAIINSALTWLQWPTGWSLLTAAVVAGSLSVWVLPRRTASTTASETRAP